MAARARVPLQEVTTEQYKLPKEFAQYKVKQVLGNGSYGTVLRVLDGEKNKMCAVKVMENPHDRTSQGWVATGVVASSIREVAILHSLKHPNIITIYNVLCAVEATYVVMECLAGTVFDELRTLAAADPPQKGFPERLQQDYFKQLMTALQYLQEQAVVHRDLKPQNLLLSSSGRLKICDFGMARQLELPPRHTTREVVSPMYRAPELMLQSKCVASPSIDMWSSGAILYEMASGTPLIQSNEFSEVAVLMAIFKIFGTPNHVPAYKQYPHFNPQWPNFPIQFPTVPNLDHRAVEVLKGLLEYDPNERWSAEEVLEDPWMAWGDGN